MRRRSFLVAVVGLGGVLPAAPCHGGEVRVVLPDVELCPCELGIVYKGWSIKWPDYEM